MGQRIEDLKKSLRKNEEDEESGFSLSMGFAILLLIAGAGTLTYLRFAEVPADYRDILRYSGLGCLLLSLILSLFHLAKEFVKFIIIGVALLAGNFALDLFFETWLVHVPFKIAVVLIVIWRFVKILIPIVVIGLIAFFYFKVDISDDESSLQFNYGTHGPSYSNAPILKSPVLALPTRSV